MILGLSLIALALGYQVFLAASKEKEGLKSLGRVVGAFVMIAAFLGIVCGAMKCSYMGKCFMMSKGCPLSAKTANP